MANSVLAPADLGSFATIGGEFGAQFGRVFDWCAAVQLHVLGTVEKLKVLKSIVAAIVVDVMHMFVRSEVASEMLSHDQAMLGDVSSAVGHRMPAGVEDDVTIVSDVPTALPQMMIGATVAGSVPMGVSHRIVDELAPAFVSTDSDRGRLAATTQTDPRGNLVRFGDDALASHPTSVALLETRRQ